MKIMFRGWGREVFPHEVEVTPVTKTDGTFYPSERRRSLRWANGMTAFGKVEGLALSGAFLAEFTFTEAELRDWLRSYLAAEPDSALQLISSVQTEAIRRLAKNSKNA
jgi:hypothetical protein